MTSTGRSQVPVLTLCRQIGVSERRLQTAFREVYDMTPRTFMRMRALQGAHEALKAAESSTVGVNDIAATHGFAHRSRFAALHEAVYGQLPSSVLQRNHAESGPSNPVPRSHRAGRLI